MDKSRKSNCASIKNDDVVKNIFKCLLFVMLCARPISGKFSNETMPNDFVERCRRDCVIKRDIVVCGKYRLVRWLHEVVREKEFTYGPLKIIKIPPVTKEFSLPELPRPRDLKFGIETLNFIKKISEDFVTKRAIVYTFEPPMMNSRAFASGPLIVDEDEMRELQKHQGSWRLFKKKKSIILPVLILLNLVKLKLLLIPVVFGVHIIKKLLVIGGLFVPGFLARLKICKVPPPRHPPPSYQTWASASEAVDYPTAYGHDEPGWSHRNDISGYYGYSPYGPSYYRQR